MPQPRHIWPTALLTGTATAVLAAASLAGCGSPEAPAAPAPAASAPAASAAGPPAPGPSAAAGSFAAAGPNGAGTLNGTDIAWLQLTIAMDEALLPLLDLAPAQSADRAVRAVAADLRTQHAAALTALHGIRATAGLGTDNPHAGHRMPGMITPDILTAARERRDTAFDTLFRDALLGHLDQCVQIARSEHTAGADPATKRWADRIAKDRTAIRERVAALT